MQTSSPNLNHLSLALNLSVQPFSFTLSLGNSSITHSENNTPNFSEDLPAFLAQAATSLGSAINKIDTIIVIPGPGAYTGSRLAVTLANTLKQISGCSVFKVSSLSAQLLPFSGAKGIYLSIINGRSGHLITQLFRVTSSIEALTEPVSWTTDSFSDQCKAFREPITVVTSPLSRVPDITDQPVIRIPINTQQMIVDVQPDTKVSARGRVFPIYSHGPIIGKIKV